jgi:hypothetical protein
MGVKLAAASGGSVELVPTNTASNYTVTFPASTGTVLTSVAQSIPRAALPVGSVIQVANYQTGTLATGTGAIPFDNTIPQITEGTEFMSLAFTPTSATSKLLIQVVWVGANPSLATNGFSIALFAAGTANALACIFTSIVNSSVNTYPFNHFMTAGTTSSITFSVRAGSGNGNTTSFNGQSGSQLGGGVTASSITVTEIAA